jgi:hypothetical protein
MNMEMHFEPFFANALQFAFDKATTEGKVTIGLLAIASMLSWTVIIKRDGSCIARPRRVSVLWLPSFTARLSTFSFCFVAQQYTRN